MKHLLPFAALSLAVPFAQAQSVKAELEITPNEDGPGAVLMLTLTSSEHAHWYYANPGPGGLAPEFDWTLPEGWNIGEPSYALPQRFESYGMVTYGYDGAATINFPLSASKDAESGEISVAIDALVCTDEICLPAVAEVSAPLPEVTPGDFTFPTPDPLAVVWNLDQQRLELQFDEKEPPEHLNILPYEDIVDHSEAPVLLEGSDQIWTVSFSHQPGDARAMPAWISWSTADGKPQSRLVTLVPSAE